MVEGRRLEPAGGRDAIMGNRHQGRKRLRRGVAVAASVAAVLGTGALAGATAASATARPGTAPAGPAWHHGSAVKHVLLISVDGLH
jgi:hypothetical protein